jgi:transcriptional regulator with XRE-family HTH domain
METKLTPTDVLHPLMKFRLSQTPPMSQSKLAELIGVTRSCINRIEMGTRLIGIDILARMARETGLPPAILRPDLKAVLKKGSIRRRKRKGK